MASVSLRYHFTDDYSEGAHPDVLEALARTNLSQQPGYGADEYSENARKTIRQLIGDDPAHVYFTPGGTGANLLAIASHLRPHECVLSVEDAHIVGKEGGAIEATGHQVITVPGDGRGKLTVDQIRERVVKQAMFAYQPKVKMVSVSQATEMGTVYTKSELQAIAAVCKELGLLLLLDGARLAHALASAKSGMTLKDVYKLTDVFWIGGTKNGALLGEAVVIKDPTFGRDFQWHMKQRGQLLAKGRVLGIQFDTLLKDDLWLRLAQHANLCASDTSVALEKFGFKLWAQTETNQIFVILQPGQVKQLNQKFGFHVWTPFRDDTVVVRLVFSWASHKEQLDSLLECFAEWYREAK